jgi:prevent-host-death family protein
MFNIDAVREDFVDDPSRILDNSVNATSMYCGRSSMSKIPAAIPLADLRRDADRVLQDVRDSNEPLFITEEGRTAAVLLSPDAYERAESERQILPSLARGEMEIAAGVGYSLDSVLAEADSLLASA